MATALRLTFILWMAVPFPYFISSGGNIFTVPKLRDTGAVLGMLSFASGMLCVVVMGLFYGLWIIPALCGAVLASCSLLLYEWTRRTAVDRHFYVGLAEQVPPTLCDTGPYHHVRHPFYLSYILAFFAVAVAFPSFVVVGVCLIDMGLFVYLAFDDERVLLASPLGAAYAAYRGRVGMFLPRLGR